MPYAKIWVSTLCGCYRLDIGVWFNIKMLSYQYRKSHCWDKMILWCSVSTVGFPILVRQYLYTCYIELDHMPHNKAVHFLKVVTVRNFIAHLWGWDLGCLSGVQNGICVLPGALLCWYCCIFQILSCDPTVCCGLLKATKIISFSNFSFLTNNAYYISSGDLCSSFIFGDGEMLIYYQSIL